MATYRIVELLDDENAAARGVREVVHRFAGDNPFEIANAMDALQDQVAESMFYAEVLGADGNWYPECDPGDIDDDYLLDGNRWVLRKVYLREQGVCAHCICPSPGGTSHCTCDF